MATDNETMGDRLKLARVKAGYDSARKAAIAFGWPTSTYGAHENGQNNFSPEEAEKYASAFDVDDAWLLTGRGRQAEEQTVKVIGRIGAGGSIDTSTEQIGVDDPLYEIRVSGLLIDDPIAYEVMGESMVPRYDDGDIVIVSARGVEIDNIVSREAAVRTRDDARYLKIVEEGSKPGLYDLISHNARPIRDAEVVWASRVAHVIRADLVRKRVKPLRHGR